MDYRKRMYDAHISTLWKYTHSLSLAEYEHLRKVYRRRFSPFLPRDKDARMIDLACGAGHFLYFLQKEDYSGARGIDISEEQLEVARQVGVKNVEVGDFTILLSQHKEEFDFISANDVIEHLKKDEVLELLDLVYAALKPGGTTFMMTPNAASLFGSRLAFIDFTHETPFTAESLAQVLRVAGFEDVAVYGEKPIAHSLGSAARTIMWKLLKNIVKGYLLIEGSIGFGLWKREVILEPRMFVVGRKPSG